MPDLVLELQELIATELKISARFPNEAALGAAVDVAVDGVCIYDLAGAIVEVSRPFAKMLGYGRDAIRAVNVADLVADKAELIFEDAENRSCVVELRLRCLSGSVVDVECHIKAIEVGGRTLIYAVNRDIGERKRANQAIRTYREELEVKNRAIAASERKFSNAMANAPLPMALLTTDVRLLEVNATLCELVGYSREEMLGSPLTQYFASEDTTATAASFNNLRRLATGEVGSLRVIRQYVHKDGHRIPVQVDVSVARGADGQVEYFIAQGQDISSRLTYEARLKALLDVAVDGVCIHDRDGQIVEFSQSLADMLGYDRNEMATLNIAGFEADRKTSDLKAAFRRMAHHPGNVVIETRYRRKDGTLIDVEVNSKAVALGGKTLFYTSSRDICERKQLAAALAEDRKLLQAVVDASPYGTALFNANLECVLRNESYGRVLDFRKDLLEHTPFTLADQLKFRHARGDDLPDYSGVASAHDLIVLLRRWQAEGRPLRSEQRLSNGRWVEGRFAFLESGDLLATFVDVSEYKRIEAELRQAKDRVETAAAAGVVGVWDYDAASRTTSWDGVMREIYNVGDGDFANAGEAHRARLHPQDRDRVVAEFAGAVEIGRAVEGDYRIVWPDGKIRHLRTLGRPTRTPDGTISGMLGVTYDITEQSEAAAALAEAKAHAEEAKAQAESANTAKTDFLSSISHEIRTPLNAILGMTQLLARSPLDAEQRDFVRKLDSAGENMLVLLSDVLDLSKIESGRLTLEQTPFVLSSLLESVRDTFSVSAEKKRLYLRIDPFPEGLPTLLGDPTRLRQIVINFIGNAIKFTDRGGITISVEALDRADDRIRFRISVRDTGIGIASENMGKLFEPFVQAEKGTYRKFGGTGLGLSISKRLVAMMGGEIGVDSEPGRGSAFWFAITLMTSAISLIKEAPLAVAPGERQLSGMRLLIVDDTETNREVAARLLALEGAICETAENGRAAIERLQRGLHDFDCVLMDVQMPEMDGLEATRVIRYDLKLVDLPVIALTAGAMASQKDQAIAAGMNGFVGKPFRLRELVSALAPLARDGQEPVRRRL